MKGTLYENGQEKGAISNFIVTPGKNEYEEVMGERVLVGKTNATATFTSPIGSFDPSNAYEVRCGKQSHVIKVTKQVNNQCFAIIENNSKEDGETSLP